MLTDYALANVRDSTVPLNWDLAVCHTRSDAHIYVDAVVAQMHDVADSDQHVHLVSSEGLSKLPDGIHYDTAGQLELGLRFAQAVLQPAGRVASD